MANKFSILIGSSVIAASVTLASSSFSLANAAVVNFLVSSPISSDTTPITFDVTVTDITGGVKVNLAVDDSSTNTGDIFGAFFDILSPTTGVTVSGADVTAFSFNTSNLGGGNNINPAGPFDVGVTFGTSGSSGGLLTSTMFNVNGVTVNDFLSQQFAVRAQSSGPAPDGGSGSTKVIGTVPNEAIPEPLTMLGVGTALGFGTLFKKRLAKVKKD